MPPRTPCTVKHKFAMSAYKCPKCRHLFTAPHGIPLPARDGDATWTMLGNVLSYSRRRPDGHLETHRDNGPAVMRFSIAVATQVEQVEYWSHGVQHRDGDAPAVVKFSPIGGISEQLYMRDGKFFRDGDMPTVEVFSPGGQLQRIAWHNGIENDAPSRGVPGPAQVRLSPAGTASCDWRLPERGFVSEQEYIYAILAERTGVSAESTRTLEALAKRVTLNHDTWTLDGLPNGPDDVSVRALTRVMGD